MHRKIQVRLTQIALAFLALAWAGCTTPHARLYEGPARERAEVAVLKVQWTRSGPSARIETIDGRPVEKGRAFAQNIQEAELLPGAHTLEVSYFNGPITSISNARLSFTCKAGGVYDLHVAPVDEGFRGAVEVGVGGKGHWTAWIIETDTKKVLAGEPRTTAVKWYE